MDGDPDVKRPRLDQDQAIFPPPASRLPLTPAPPQLEPHPPSAGPAATPHPFPPGQHSPGQHHYHPPAQTGAPPYRETLPDPRSLSQYQQPPGPPGPPDPRTGYGPINAPLSSPYPPDREGSRRPSVSAHPQVTESLRGPAPPPATQDTKPVHMEHGVHHQGYPPPSMDPYVNGGAPNGLPYHPPPEGYPGAPVAPPPHSYPPTPVTGYPQPTGYAQGPSTYGSVKRKQVRAQQACNNCRQRKQKCDEARPCGYCKQEQLECEYKEVPPPKTDRTMALLMEKVEKSESATHNLDQKISQTMDQLFRSIDHISKQISNQQKDDDVVPVKPEEHHTGAHHLMNKWAVIKDFFGKANVTREEYVHDAEEQRSLLDPYDWLSLPENDPAHEVAIGRSPSSTGYQPEYASAGSPPQYPSWAPKYSATSVKSELPALGGLGSDRKLALDENTVRILHDSYVENMWTMHPFIDLRVLKRMVNQFISVYSSTPFHPWVYPGAPEPQEPYSGIGLKRKRPTMSGEDHSTPSSPGSLQPEYSRRDHMRPIETAIVLLVLALGKILQYNGYILEDPNAAQSRSTSTPSGMFAVPQQTPTQTYIKPSPPSSSSYAPPIASGISPGFERPSSGAESRGSPGGGFVGFERRDRERRPHRNLDIIPGLAYFAPASLILGTQHAGNDIPHAQAYLLAGLYMGQLGRVLDSWNHIYTASRMVVVLLRTKHYNNLKTEDVESQPEMDDISNTVSFLYWSTLQLESDIRAELDKLPPSLIWGYEDSLRYPSHLMGVERLGGYEQVELQHEKLSVRDVMFHYFAQISIRKTLNRAHAALYSVEDHTKKAERGAYKLSWADADAPQLWEGLQEWRRSIPPFIQWKDHDEPASDINNARLRGKYYGAAYVITRPYLHSALYNMEPEVLQQVDWSKHIEGSPGSAPHTGTIAKLPSLGYTSQQQVDHIIWACKQCIDAAIKSTVAFDVCCEGLSKRPRVTNIHGTSAAQFSNILVLAAAYKNPYLRKLIPEERFWQLMARTISLLTRLSPLSPVFVTNKRVLEAVQRDLVDSRNQSYGTPSTGIGRGGSIQSTRSSFSGQ